MNAVANKLHMFLLVGVLAFAYGCVSSHPDSSSAKAATSASVASPLKVGVYAIGAAAVILYLYLIPVMTVFEDSLPHLIRNTVYFLCKKPLRTLVILFFDIFPFVLTFSDLQSLPLYAFLWVLCGFGLQAMLAATLLLPVFAPYLDAKAEDRNEAPSEESEEYPMTEEEILEDMRKLGM